MKIAIVGSRSFNDYKLLEKFILEKIDIKDIELIVSGGAKGADSLAVKFASTYNIPLVIYKPDWDRYGKKAGYLRNHTIVDNSDVVFAFWDGESKGTKHSIDIAMEKNKSLYVLKEVGIVDPLSNELKSVYISYDY